MSIIPKKMSGVVIAILFLMLVSSATSSSPTPSIIKKEIHVNGELFGISSTIMVTAYCEVSSGAIIWILEIHKGPSASFPLAANKSTTGENVTITVTYTVTENDPTGKWSAILFMKGLSGTSKPVEINNTTFQVDTIRPTAKSIVINNGDEYTSSHSVQLHLSASDRNTGVAKMQFSNDNEMWTRWTDFSNNFSYTLPTGDGKKTVYFRVMDKAGNIGNIASDSIILDTKPPSNLDIKINDGAKYTTKREVILSLHCEDENGIDKISVYNDISPNPPDDWIKYVEKLEWTLSSDEGLKSVFFTAKDYAGNIAEYVWDDIIYDCTPPKSRVNTLSEVQYSEHFTVSWYGEDEISGIKYYTVEYKDGESDNWKLLVKTNDTSTTFKGENGHTYFFRCKATDNAGNAELDHPKWDTSTTVRINISIPSCIIEYPINGEKVSGIVVVSGTASDDMGIAIVEVKIDDGEWEEATGREKWEYSWDTTTSSEGEHEISARAWDGEYYSPEVSVRVVVFHDLGINIEIDLERDNVISGGMVNVTVRALRGNNPLPEAYIYINSSLGRITPQIGTTDRDGIFRCVYTSPEVESVIHDIITAIGKTPIGEISKSSAEISIVPEGGFTLKIDAEKYSIYSCEEIEITVSVMNSTGPVSGIKVHIESSDGTLDSDYGITDEYGKFKLKYTGPDVFVRTEISIYASDENNTVESSLLIEVIPSSAPIDITYPEPGETVNGTVIIMGNASSKAIQVQIKIDDGTWQLAENTTSWQFVWNTSKFSNGYHRIYARIFDGKSYSEEVYISVIVENAVLFRPIVIISWPENGTTVSGKIKIYGKSYHTVQGEKIMKVEIKFDSKEWTSVEGTTDWHYYLDTRKMKNDEHIIKVRAYDGKFYSLEESVVIEVKNIEPSWLEMNYLYIIAVILAVVCCSAASGYFYTRGSVEDILYIYRDGRLIKHVGGALKDRDILSGMITAVQEFIMDSLNITERREGHIGEIKYGEHHVIVCQGRYSYLAVFLLGKKPLTLGRKMRETLKDIEEYYEAVLHKWDGDISRFDGIEKYMRMRF